MIARRAEEGQALATKLNATWVAPGDERLDPSVDMILLAITDTAIGDCTRQIRSHARFAPLQVSQYPLLVHTSGRTPLSALESYQGPTGVFYPVQSMSKAAPVAFSNVPVLLEARDSRHLSAMAWVASCISERVEYVDSEGRLALHVCGVMINNFVNHLNARAEALAQAHNLNFDLLHTAILRTARVAVDGKAREAQTGPGIRRDRYTTEAHKEFLRDRRTGGEEKRDLLAVYEAMTDSIERYHWGSVGGGTGEGEGGGESEVRLR